MNEIVVLITTKNRPQFLENRAFKSVGRQSAIISEVIVSDNSDQEYIEENKSIVYKFNESVKSTYLVNQRTPGVSGATNTGINYIIENYANPSNVYIAILDDNDEWKENYISGCREIVNDNNKVDWISTNFYRVENILEQPILQNVPKSVNSDMFLIENPGIQGSNLFIRLSTLLEAWCFDENQSPSNDRDLCIRLCDLKDIVYRQNPDFAMIHYAESNRPRYSNLNTKMKNDGLKEFWLKHSGRMTQGQKDNFIIRTRTLFNWTPESIRAQKYNVNLDFKNHIPKVDRSVKNFNLYIGVISGDGKTLSKLISSLCQLVDIDYLDSIQILVLCNGTESTNLQKHLHYPLAKKIAIDFIDVSTQINDSKAGLFGEVFKDRPRGLVGIAQARTMLQKYLGLKAKKDAKAISWILDDDMRIDSRATNYIPWLPVFKENGIDVLIGSFEGSSPNPPLNGLRVLLVDLYHNLLWLKRLDPKSVLPNRSNENQSKRTKYPDYYYDLSRKHTAHLESPHWIEPNFEGETVGEAYQRLLTSAPLVVAGYPFTRPIISPKITGNPLNHIKPSVNRGGNTFILNTDALLKAPNLILKINGREGRRSDMIWAITNKHINDMNIVAVPFPILHDGRVTSEKSLNLPKVIDEIVGSTIYAALCDFLNENKHHSLQFTETEIKKLWSIIMEYRKVRLHKLYKSYMRIIGLVKTIAVISSDEELGDLLNYLKESFTIDNYNEIKKGVMQMEFASVKMFLSTIHSDSKLFATTEKKG